MPPAPDATLACFAACSQMCTDVAWRNLFRQLALRKACRFVTFSAFRYIIVTLTRAGPFTKCVWANECEEAIVRISPMRYRIDYMLLSPLQLVEFLTTEAPHLAAKRRDPVEVPSPVTAVSLSASASASASAANVAAASAMQTQQWSGEVGIESRQLRLALLLNWFERQPAASSEDCARLLSMVVNLPSSALSRCFSFDPVLNTWTVAEAAVLAAACQKQTERINGNAHVEPSFSASASASASASVSTNNLTEAGRFWRKQWKQHLEKMG
jgi:hypothetical protein